MVPATDPRFTLTASLLQAGRQWRRLAQQVLAEHDISEARAATLIWAGRLGGGVRQVTLAACVGIECTSLVRLLDQLSALGLLERRGDPGDRRANSIWLSEAGEELAARIEQALTELRGRVLGDVSDADLHATLRVLGAIDRAATDSRAQPALAHAERAA
jgi:MarR family transcriptional regulator, transcriptional regulator for hemolysin